MLAVVDGVESGVRAGLDGVGEDFEGGDGGGEGLEVGDCEDAEVGEGEEVRAEGLEFGDDLLGVGFELLEGALEVEGFDEGVGCADGGRGLVVDHAVDGEEHAVAVALFVGHICKHLLGRGDQALGIEDGVHKEVGEPLDNVLELVCLGYEVDVDHLAVADIVATVERILNRVFLKVSDDLFELDALSIPHDRGTKEVREVDAEQWLQLRGHSGSTQCEAKVYKGSRDRLVVHKQRQSILVLVNDLLNFVVHGTELLCETGARSGSLEEMDRTCAWDLQTLHHLQRNWLVVLSLRLLQLFGLFLEA